MRQLVLGCGNLFAADDAVGLWVVRYLKDQLKTALPPQAVVLEAGTPGLNLIDYWEAGDRVILVDAVQSGLPVGAVQRFELKDLPLRGQLVGDAHGLGILDALELARLTGNLPKSLTIVGIEIENENPFQFGLSPAVEKAIIPAAQAVLAELHRE
jgi:hydrogenase maturation protease